MNIVFLIYLTLFLTFPRIFEALSFEWRNSTPHFASSPEKIEKILINNNTFTQRNRTYNFRVLSHI